jgi:hypothetical protein
MRLGMRLLAQGVMLKLKRQQSKVCCASNQRKREIRKIFCYRRLHESLLLVSVKVCMYFWDVLVFIALLDF